MVSRIVNSKTSGSGNAVSSGHHSHSGTACICLRTRFFYIYIFFFFTSSVTKPGFLSLNFSAVMLRHILYFKLYFHDDFIVCKAFYCTVLKNSERKLKGANEIKCRKQPRLLQLICVTFPRDHAFGENRTSMCCWKHEDRLSGFFF